MIVITEFFGVVRVRLILSVFMITVL